MDDFYIVIPFKRLAKDRKKRLIDFNTLDIGSGFRKGLVNVPIPGPTSRTSPQDQSLLFLQCPLQQTH